MEVECLSVYINKSAGKDATSLVTQFRHFFSLYFSSEIFTDILKLAYVTPISKKKDPKSDSGTSGLAKVMDKIINRILVR